MLNLQNQLTEKSSWQDVLLNDLMKEKFAIDLREFIKRERIDCEVFPEPEEVFRIYKDLAPSDVKVVIMGVDPYLTPGHADGYAYSCKKLNTLPKVLEIILREVYQQHLKTFRPAKEVDFSLKGWVKQGVFLLNSILTSTGHRSKSHKNKGWEVITRSTIRYLGQESEQPIVFMFWGPGYNDYKQLVDKKKHLILTAQNPAAQIYSKKASKAFSTDNKCFLEANKFLIENGRGKIDWLSFNSY